MKFVHFFVSLDNPFRWSSKYVNIVLGFSMHFYMLNEGFQGECVCVSMKVCVCVYSVYLLHVSNSHSIKKPYFSLEKKVCIISLYKEAC